tara:strand:- start:2603 stop:2728 length:126 start_codon:yes stop_codon:yes gene_type:complete
MAIVIEDDHMVSATRVNFFIKLSRLYEQNRRCRRAAGLAPG